MVDFRGHSLKLLSLKMDGAARKADSSFAAVELCAPPDAARQRWWVWHWTQHRNVKPQQISTRQQRPVPFLMICICSSGPRQFHSAHHASNNIFDSERYDFFYFQCNVYNLYHHKVHSQLFQLRPVRTCWINMHARLVAVHTKNCHPPPRQEIWGLYDRRQGSPRKLLHEWCCLRHLITH